MRPKTNDRLVTVDALRGFALLGIMLVHFLNWYTAGPLPQDVYAKYNDIGSNVANIFTNLFLSGKFFALFSFLFGLSFYLQMRGLEHDKKTFVRRYSWRLALLMVIGMIHHALWQGDILSIYVPLGFVLLAMRKLSNKAILITGILLAINLPGRILDIAQYFTTSSGQPFGDFAAMGKQYHDVITKGSLTEIMIFNLKNFSTKYNFQVFSGRLFITLGFFLLGTYVGRKKWFENAEASKEIIRKVCKRSALIMGIGLAIGLGMFAADAIFKLGWQQNRVAGSVFMTIYDIYNASMVAFFVTGLTLIMYRRGGQKVFYPLAPVGKMALTSYITQTVVGLLLFWGIGLAIYPKTSPGINFMVGLGFFFIQVLFSKFWLKYFNYGPLEWLWRSGTLLKWQRLVKRKNTTLREQVSDRIVTTSPTVMEEA